MFENPQIQTHVQTISPESVGRSFNEELHGADDLIESSTDMESDP